MWFGFWILGAFLWILLAFWPAKIAASKGRSFLGFFILSLFFWWVTLFWALAMQDDSPTTEAA
jgi:hypothetical protein